VKITRTTPDDGWVPIANTAVRDHRLSWRARGLLAELLSYPPGWETTVRELVELGRAARKDGGHAEGRDAMYAAMEELHTFRYVAYTRLRNEDGHWGTSIEVSDAPIPARLPENPESVDQESVSQESVDQESGDQVVTTKTETNTDTNTDLEKDGNEYSESLASLAVAAAAATADEDRQLKLKLAYEAIDLLGDDGRRTHLLVVEQKRPKIYREARQAAIIQIRKASPQVLKTEHGVPMIDQLSYKYVVMHYVLRSVDERVPEWLGRHLFHERAA
jgi:hypothetical protein